ncbi:hypothetical protein BDF19DRAFT_419830 [Syncephalis fuscata]|nr:hypothetical protein BDF19DRAFT_419830 [Syncephalis fuscata]
MAEVNPFDASFRRSNEEAAAAAAAVVAAVTGVTDSTVTLSMQQTMTNWQPPVFTAVNPAQVQPPSDKLLKRARSPSPVRNKTNNNHATDGSYDMQSNNSDVNNKSNKSNNNSSFHDEDEDDDDDDDGDNVGKRQKFLERNRVAAFKCRQKRKVWMQELETKSEEVTKRNKALQLLVSQLKEEAIQLKNQMLAHQDCDCNVIQQYVKTSGLFNNNHNNNTATMMTDTMASLRMSARNGGM